MFTQPLCFRPFTRTDWGIFGGCESENPLIACTAETEKGYRIVIDGEYVGVHSNRLDKYGIALVESWGLLCGSEEEALTLGRKVLAIVDSATGSIDPEKLTKLGLVPE